MNIVIHQPHFLPWIGYFNKLANSSVYVVQDNVQFRKRYFQNRTRIRSINSDFLWLTVPVHATRETMVRDVVASGNWKIKILKTIWHTYKKAPFFDNYYPEIEKIIVASNDNICDLNIDLLRLISLWLGISYEVRFASDFIDSPPPPDGLAYIGQELGADNYIFGEGGGLVYHGTAVFHKRGISIEQQHFHDPYEKIALQHWSQCTNLSVIDYLFFLGADVTSSIAKNTWRSSVL